jgi:hypothetical protein
MARRNGFGEESGSVFHYILIAVAVYAGYWMCTNNASFMDFVDHVKSMVGGVSKFGKDTLDDISSLRTGNIEVSAVTRSDGKSVLDLIKDRCSEGGGFKNNPTHRGLCWQPFDSQNVKIAEKLCATKPDFKSKYSGICAGRLPSGYTVKAKQQHRARKHRYLQLRNTIGSVSQWNCPGAKGVVGGGNWCQFNNKQDAIDYCNSKPECAGFSQQYSGNKTFQLTKVLSPGANKEWQFWKKTN